MTNRVGLYALVIAGVLTSCKINGRVKLANERLERLESSPRVVEGEDSHGKFYLVNGQKAYVTINGKPISEYFAQTRPAEKAEKD